MCNIAKHPARINIYQIISILNSNNFAKVYTIPYHTIPYYTTNYESFHLVS